MQALRSFYYALWDFLTRASLLWSKPFIRLMQKYDTAWMRHGIVAVLFIVASVAILILRNVIGLGFGSLLQIIGGGLLFFCGFSIAWVYFLIQTERENIANGFLYHEDYYNDWYESEEDEGEDSGFEYDGPPMPEAKYIHLDSKVTLGSLVAACLGMAIGFSLISQGFYLFGFESWYTVADGDANSFTGWLLYSLLSIFRAVDIFDTLPTFDIKLAVIRQSSWISALMVFAFKIFFDLILLSQLRSWWTRRTLMRQSTKALQHPLMQARAAETLRRIGKSALPKILDLLDRGDTDTKISLIYVLGRLNAKQAIPNLLVLLKTSSDPLIRQAVAETLGDIQATESSPALLHAMNNDPSDNVRIQAIKSLTELGNVDAMDPMFKALETEKDEDVRSALIDALGILTPENNFEIMHHVNDVCIEIVQNDHSDAVRRSACQALAYMELEESVPILCKVLLEDTDDDVREEAADALYVLEHNDAMPALIQAIKNDKDDGVRSSAVYALSNMDAEPHSKLLINLLKKDPSKLVRRAAAETLGELGIEKAEDALQAALQDPAIREAARNGLAALYYDEDDDEEDDEKA